MNCIQGLNIMESGANFTQSCVNKTMSRADVQLGELDYFYPKEYQECSNDYVECRMQKYVYLVGGPLLLLLSAVGNSLTLAVMTRPSLRKSSSAVFIAALALTDTAASFTGLLRHLIIKISQVDVRQMSPMSCKLQRFVLYVALDTSSWLLTAVTLERFLAVCHVVKHRKFCKPKTAAQAIAAIVVFQISFNAQVFFTRGVEDIENFNSTTNYSYINCGYTSPSAKHYWTYYHSWLSMLIYCIIPFITMLILNCFIVHKLRHLQRRPSTIKRLAASSTGFMRHTSSMTHMLLAVTIYFIVVTTPTFIFTIVEGFLLDIHDIDDKKYAKMELVDAICSILLYLNHSINFFLYCLTGVRFRRELYAMLGCTGKHGRQRSSQTKPSKFITDCEQNSFLQKTNVMTDHSVISRSSPSHVQVTPKSHRSHIHVTPKSPLSKH